MSKSKNVGGKINGDDMLLGNTNASLDHLSLKVPIKVDDKLLGNTNPSSDYNIKDYLSLKVPSEFDGKLLANEDTKKKNEMETIVETLRSYYNTPPSEKILPYLLLNFIEFEKLKKSFPLKINVTFYDDVGLRGWNSFEAQYIYCNFDWKSQKNYIVNLAYQEEYFNFFTEEDRNMLSKYYAEYSPDMEEKIDVVFRTRTLQAITKKNSEFPFDDLIYCLGLFD